MGPKAGATAPEGVHVAYPLGYSPILLVLPAPKQTQEIGANNGPAMDLAARPKLSLTAEPGYPSIHADKSRWAEEVYMSTVFFEDLEIDSVHLGRESVCDKDEMLEYSRRNDPWPFHVDEAAAAHSPFGGVIASGGYVITLWYRSLIEIDNTPTTTWAFLGGFDWKLKFLAPVRAADTLRAKVTVKDKRLSSKPGRGVITLFHEILNQRSEVVCTVEVIALVATRSPMSVAEA